MRHFGKVTAEELVASIAELQDMVKQGAHPVHVIIDASAGAGRPEVALGDLKSIIPPVVEGVGWMVVVQPYALQRFFTALGMQISGAKYKFVKDEREALDYLVQQDPTLNDVIR